MILRKSPTPLKEFPRFLSSCSPSPCCQDFPSHHGLWILSGTTQRFQPSCFSWKPPIFRYRFHPPVFASKPPIFMFSLKKSQICYTYSLKSSQNSTSNVSLLKQLNKPDRIVKNQDRLRSLQVLQTTKHDHNIVENSSC